MKKTLAILLAGLLMLSLLTGCGADSSACATESYSAKTADVYYEEAAVSGYWDNGSYDYDADYSYAEEAEYEAASESALGSDSADVSEDLTADSAEKIIYTAYVQLETTEFDRAVAMLEDMVETLGGYIESSNVYGDVSYNSDGTTEVVNRYASYRVAVPAASFETALTKAGTIGNVTSKSRNAENITSQYADIETRVHSLEVQEERILALMEAAEDIDSLIQLEQRLSEITYEKESYQRSLKNYDRQVSYSTINFDVQEVEVYTPTVPVTRTFGEKLADAFSDGWTGFGRSIQNFVIGIAEALPYLLVLAVLAVVIVLLVRGGKKRRAAKKAKKAQAVQTPGSETPNS